MPHILRSDMLPFMYIMPLKVNTSIVFKVIKELELTIDEQKILNICEYPESGYVEYKQEWYFDPNKSSTAKEWGELIKDIIALANGNSSCVNKTRYLIIGYNEEQKRFLNVDISDNLQQLKTKILAKVNSHLTDNQLQNINISKISVKNRNILCIEIKQHPCIFMLSKDLQTKTVTHKKNSILVRGIDSSDEVSLASPSEILSLETLLAQHHPENITNNIIVRHKTIKNTVEEFLAQNKSYRIEKSPDINNNFEVFHLVSKIKSNQDIYFIFIRHDAPQKKTFERIQQLYPNIQEPVVLTDRPFNVDNSKRIDNLKQASKWNNISFIDQFGKESLYSDPLSFLPKPSDYTQEYFVKGLAQYNNTEQEALEVLQEWYKKEHSPLAVIKGTGGIGKTTLAKEFLSVIKGTDIYEPSVLFINSTAIISELRKNNISDLFDIYNSYSNIENQQNNHDFTRNLLSLSVDNGSVIVVLDGLDEIIVAKGSEFNVEQFIRSILQHYSFNFGRCKILVTCRDHFWLEDFQEIEYSLTLIPFNQNLADAYFNKSLNGDHVKAGKAKSLAKKFNSQTKTQSTDKNIMYSPFVLDTIRDLVQTQQEKTLDNNKSFEEIKKQLYLSSSLPNDYLIFAVCNRDENKLKRIKAVDQMKIFTQLAVEKQGAISSYDIKPFITDILKETVGDETIDSLISHFFLIKKGDMISFRYDFFLDFFRTLYITSHFLETDFNTQLVKIIEDNISLYNDFSSQISKRVCQYLINDDKDEIVFKFMELLEIPNLIPTQKSAIFCLYLNIMKELGSLHDKNDLNDAMRKLFGSPGNIKDLCLIRIHRHDQPKIEFDFKGIKLNNIHFEDFDGFMYCDFDQDTKFFNSTIKLSIQKHASKDVKLKREMFDDECILCNQTQQLLENLANKQNTIFTKRKKDLETICRLFHSNGILRPQKEVHIKSRCKHIPLLEYLLDKNILIKNTESKLNDQELIIHPDYKMDLLNFIEQGTLNGLVNRIINAH